MATWTYEGYWNAVLGARSAAHVIGEFGLNAAGLDTWLKEAESESWAMGGEGAPMPAEWAEFHARALVALERSCEATAEHDADR